MEVEALKMQPKDKTCSCEQLSSAQLLVTMHASELDKTNVREKRKDTKQLLSIFKLYHTRRKNRYNMELQPNKEQGVEHFR